MMGTMGERKDDSVRGREYQSLQVSPCAVCHGKPASEERDGD